MFLGFAFNKLNTKLLTPSYGDHEFAHTPQVYATTCGISESDELVIRDQISRLYNNRSVRINLKNTHCVSFFSEFKMGLGYDN